VNSPWTGCRVAGRDEGTHDNRQHGSCSGSPFPRIESTLRDCPQLREQLSHVLVPVLPILSQRFPNDAIQLRRDFPLSQNVRGVVLENRGNRRGDGGSAKRRPIGEHFEHHHAKAEDVASSVDVAPLSLLRRHVRRGAEHDAGERLVRRGAARFRCQPLGQPEIDHLHHAIGPQHDVFRLDVAMDDPRVVRRQQCAGDLSRDAARLGCSDRAAHARPKRLPVDHLRRDVVMVAGGPDVIDDRDIRMIE
jgi:hypothetical protein